MKHVLKTKFPNIKNQIVQVKNSDIRLDSENLKP